MREPTTLIIKHIPPSLTDVEQEELFKLFGAKRVRCMRKRGKFKGIAFVAFNNSHDAKQALLKLHQLEVLDQCLNVEFARKEDQCDFPQESDFPPFQAKDGEEIKTPKAPEKMKLQTFVDDFSKTLHGICPQLGLDYLPSPLLRYKYPPPNATIITNISHALVSVPKFYTQVLHLMNKMNLPAPFGPITPSPPLFPDQPMLIPELDNVDDKAGVQEMDTDTEESEIESETDVDGKNVDIAPKRVSKKVKKQHKKPKFHQPIPSTTLKTSEPRTEPSDVFESHTQLENQKKILFNIKPTLDVAENVGVSNASEESTGFGIIEVSKADVNEEAIIQSGNESLSHNFISLSELRHKKMSEREMRTLSVFRNYSAGEPTVRLYVKNLARQVEEKDLRHIFGRFIDWDSEVDSNMFDIRLMKEGRMKGQAFVTLATENQAINAVKETNGFMLHTKPLVVQFARSAKPKDNPEKPN